MEHTADMSASKPPASHWADLPPDLLCDVSSRLNNVADFVRFHAICRPWRDLQLHSTAVRRVFPPWLLGSYGSSILHSVITIWDGATTSFRRDCDDVILVKPPGAPTVSDTNWVATEDGTAAWIFTWTPNPRLIDFLTGAVTLCPFLPCDDEIRRLMENPHGVLYSDKTLFLYSFVPDVVDGCIFAAAILRPGDAGWTYGTKSLDVLPSRYLSVAYHDGKTVLCTGVNYCCVLRVDGLRGNRCWPSWSPIDQRDYFRDASYVLESGGELLWVSILVENAWFGRGRSVRDEPPPGALLVVVHTLEEDGMMRWVARDGRSFGDRVLLLGSPASFAVDAAQLGVAGGCAYFVFGPGLYRYNLVDGEAKLVERLRQGWGANQSFMWLRPQPTIAPIKEINERLEASNKNKDGGNSVDTYAL